MDLFTANKKFKNFNKRHIILLIATIFAIVISMISIKVYQNVIFKENALNNCKNISGLINEERYEDAIASIIKLDHKSLNMGKEEIIEMFVHIVKINRIIFRDDINIENMQKYKAYKNLADAISIPSSDKRYETVKYIDKAIELEIYINSINSINIYNGEEAKLMFETFGEAVDSLQYSWSIAEPKISNAISKIQSINYLKYDVTNYDVKQLEDLRVRMTNGLTKLYKATETNNESLFEEAKTELINCTTKEKEIITSQLETIDKIEEDIAKLNTYSTL